MDTQTDKPPIPPILVIIFGLLAVSTSSVFIRYAQEEASSLVIATYRLTIASLILAPIAISKKGAELKSLNGKSIFLGLLSGTFLAIHFAAWITSLEFTSVTSSVVLVSTTPLWVALLAPITIKEPISRKTMVGMLIALAGTLVIGMSDVCTLDMGLICPPIGEFLSGEAFLGDFLALLGAWTGAGYILIGRSLRNRLSLISYIFVVYGMAALVLIAFSGLNGEAFLGFQPRTYIFLFLLALIPQLLGHSSFNWALGYLPASFVSVTLLGEPIGTTILAMILLGEIPTPFNLFGAAMIFVGILISSQKKNIK